MEKKRETVRDCVFRRFNQLKPINQLSPIHRYEKTYFTYAKFILPLFEVRQAPREDKRCTNKLYLVACLVLSIF